MRVKVSILNRLTEHRCEILAITINLAGLTFRAIRLIHARVLMADSVYNNRAGLGEPDGTFIEQSVQSESAGMIDC